MLTEMTYEEFLHLRDKKELPKEYRVKLTKEELNRAFDEERERQLDEEFNERMGYSNSFKGSYVPDSFIVTDADDEVL